MPRRFPEARSALLLAPLLCALSAQAEAGPAQLSATVPQGALTQSAQAEPGIEESAPIRALPLENAQALRGFFRQLSQIQEQRSKVRIAFYGDSHTAPDLITGRLRAGLSAQFGEGGAGFVTAAKPWPYHRHSLLEYAQSQGFRGVRITRSTRAGKLGLFGVALEAKKRASARLRTRGQGLLHGHQSQFELYYLKQPGGGQLRVMLDGKRVAQLSTNSRRDQRASASQAGYLRFSAKQGAHELELSALGDGPVTLFGLTMENQDPGVVIDTLGIPGARAKLHGLWDTALYSEHLKRRAPELFVLAYGTNEAGDPDFSLANYERTVRDTVRRLQSILPRAGCLLVGPTDRPERLDGTLVARASLAGIVDVQRKLAGELGCAFFDVARAMGGPLSIVQLAQLSPPLAARDYVHLNQRGYELLGDALYESLMRAYRAELPLAADAGPEARAQ